MDKYVEGILLALTGAALVEATDYVATEYADSKASLNITALGKASLPSTYLPAVEGAIGLGYALYATSEMKKGRQRMSTGNELTNDGRAVALATGAGAYGLVKTARKMLAPRATNPGAAAIKEIAGRRITAPGAGAAAVSSKAYEPAPTNGRPRGSS